MPILNLRGGHLYLHSTTNSGRVNPDTITSVDAGNRVTPPSEASRAAMQAGM